MKKNVFLALCALFFATQVFAQHAWRWEDKNGKRIITDTPPPKVPNVRAIGEKPKPARKGSKGKTRIEEAAERTLKTRCVQARDRLTYLIGTSSQEIVPPDTYTEIDNLEQFINNNCLNENPLPSEPKQN